MSTYQTRSSRYPNLRITVKQESKDRSVREVHSYAHPTTIYYNRNHRRKPSNAQPQPTKSHQLSQKPLRPLMEISTSDYSYVHPAKAREPKQRGQYRNRKAELDWDHAFDLDQIDLYTIQRDIDNYSLTSSNSSTDNSYSSN